MKKGNMPTLEEQAMALRQMDDSEIDFSDIPEILDWSNAERGRFYRPTKQHVTLRIDKDVLEWFKQHHEKYQTAINAALRKHVQKTIRESA
jgi:uncharacterized protein (DUF4415 family)